MFYFYKYRFRHQYHFKVSIWHRYREEKKKRYATLHASIAEITAQLLSLSYVYLISSDNGSIIRIFVQINILERRAGYVD